MVVLNPSVDNSFLDSPLTNHYSIFEMIVHNALVRKGFASPDDWLVKQIGENPSVDLHKAKSLFGVALDYCLCLGVVRLNEDDRFEYFRESVVVLQTCGLIDKDNFPICEVNSVINYYYSL